MGSSVIDRHAQTGNEFLPKHLCANPLPRFWLMLSIHYHLVLIVSAVDRQCWSWGKPPQRKLKLLIWFNRPLYPCIWGEIYLHLSQQTLTEWHGPKLFLCHTRHVTPFIYHVWNFQSTKSWSKSVIFQYEKFAGHLQWMWFGWRFSCTSKLINKI